MDITPPPKRSTQPPTEAWLPATPSISPAADGRSTAPSQPTAFFVSISYNGREITRAYSDDANPMSITSTRRRVKSSSLTTAWIIEWFAKASFSASSQNSTTNT